ncbi:MAG TPA: hypothetical protein VFC63_13260 [Blastocatellia bacterium]|nr:hypothetical protein [Blastocatellia bacterium]
MKSFTITVTMIALLAATISGQSTRRRTERVTTIAGEMRIESATPTANGGVSYVELNGKAIHTIPAADDLDPVKGGNYMLDIYGYYKFVGGDPSQEAVLIHESNGSSACSGVYRLISLKKDGSYQVSQSIGNCTSPMITLAADKIVLQFPRAQKYAAETWTFQNGELKRTVSTARRRKK